MTDCSCVVGYTAGADGVQCTACVAGTYKEDTGAGACSPCPGGGSSPDGSDALGDCTCTSSCFFVQVDISLPGNREFKIP